MFLIKIIFLIIVIVIAFSTILTLLYNKLVNARNLVEEGWSGVSVQLKRRHDLIPNLVEIVKGYATHEKDTLEEVVRLRSESKNEDNIQSKSTIENTITSDLKKIFALVEQYPNLKADTNFRELQNSLIEVEDNIQFSRRYFNGAVRQLNILVQSFPSNLVANFFKFEQKKFFELDYATERSSPDVSFD